MPNPRNTALTVLLKIEQDKAYSNIALNNAVKEQGLNSQDSAFVFTLRDFTAFVYGQNPRERRG